MWTKHHRKRKLGRLVMPVVAAVFLSYFGYHSVHGAYGLTATAELLRQRSQREVRLSELTATRQLLEKEVALLSDGSLDRDMLDEKARLSLNVSRADEIVIFRASH